MGADLFGSFAESTCAALVISSVSTLGTEHVYVAMCYPLLISAVGILVCLLTTLIATDLKPARGIHEIESTLKMQLVISTLLATPVSDLPCVSLPALWVSLPGLWDILLWFWGLGGGAAGEMTMPFRQEINTPLGVFQVKFVRRPKPLVAFQTSKHAVKDAWSCCAV